MSGLLMEVLVDDAKLLLKGLVVLSFSFVLEQGFESFIELFSLVICCELSVFVKQDNLNKFKQFLFCFST